MMSAFVIKCNACGWTKGTSGTSKDLEDLREVRGGCTKCGKARRFVCPRCRRVAQMKRSPSP